MVFGEVVDGMELVRRIENERVDAKTSRPLDPIVIKRCGELPRVRLKLIFLLDCSLNAVS